MLAIVRSCQQILVWSMQFSLLLLFFWRGPPEMMYFSPPPNNKDNTLRYGGSGVPYRSLLHSVLANLQAFTLRILRVLSSSLSPADPKNNRSLKGPVSKVLEVSRTFCSSKLYKVDKIPLSIKTISKLSLESLKIGSSNLIFPVKIG